MISDVLHTAVEGIDHYLGHPAYTTTYTPEMRLKIGVLRSAAEQLREELDRVPGAVAAHGAPLTPLTLLVQMHRALEVMGADTEGGA